ncbi:MAG: thioredoxin protein 12-like [Myxococcaceae bacterium]|nr:thioredoxin protein 12-like [Myxococcaceae bacterium]
MHQTSSWLRLALAIVLIGCDAPSLRSADAARPAPVSANTGSDLARVAPHDSAWGDVVAWRDWDAALRTAKAENKSVCVVVYADWCPRCKELAPVFAQPEVARAAADLIMVRQDQDERPTWLKQRLGSYGDYVPRIFFLDPNGRVREDLQSGHPRYPYFYAPLVTDRLLANMHAASRL